MILFFYFFGRENWKNKYVWRRVKDIYTPIGRDGRRRRPTRFHLIAGDRIDPDAIKQGKLGDCYFLSVLSVLANYQHRLKKLIISQKIENSSCYCVALNISGVWELVLIDDYIPCYRKTNKPCFAKSFKNEIWVMLMEKAFAKISGGYANIISGNTKDTMQMLTGAPTKSYFFSDSGKPDRVNEKELFQLLKDSIQNGFICTASSLSKNRAEKLGIELIEVEGHLQTLCKK